MNSIDASISLRNFRHHLKRDLVKHLQSGLFILPFAVIFTLNGCIGPAGPPGSTGLDGVDGVDGANGVDGVDGVDGTDASATCLLCHNNSSVLVSKQQQTSNSVHLTGGNQARFLPSCAYCHNHEGFVEFQATGGVANDIENPSAINCRTCHLIHVNLDESDWTIVTSLAVDLFQGGETVDLGGSSNLCVNCHQSRVISPFPEIGGADLTITSSRWGPHHGPHGNTLWGVGGYEVPGSISYPDPGSHPHAGIGCVSCHMAPTPYGGPAAGGHTFNMTYVYRDVEENHIDACTVCHTQIADIASFNLNSVQTTVDSLLAELETIFIGNGWMDAPGALWNAGSEAPLVVSADEAGAMLNYITIREDRSRGIHNPEYTLALLNNALESMQ